MSKHPLLTIVLPCYNPPEGWTERVLASMKTIKEQLKDEVSEINLLIVNDGSTQNFLPQHKEVITKEIPAVRFVEYEKNRGKGQALRKGVEKIKEGLIVYTDIDFPYQEDSLVAVARSLMEGNEVALGHRGKDYYDKTPWFRKVVSKTLRWVLKTFLRLPTDDSQCGLKGFDQTGASVFLNTKIDRFLFDLEFIKLSAKRKLKIALVTVELKPDVVFSRVNGRVLLREFGNFLTILFRK
ncbi:MAG: glycosyltransferase family 2 protein [Crocinitomicaceae bacterium]